MWHLDSIKGNFISLIFFPPTLCPFHSFRIPFSLRHSHTKIKGLIKNSQCNWFPHEDDPISPQWDFVLCVWVWMRGPAAWDSWHWLLASMHQWPISTSQCGHGDQLTQSGDETFKKRWEASELWRSRAKINRERVRSVNVGRKPRRCFLRGVELSYFLAVSPLCTTVLTRTQSIALNTNLLFASWYLQKHLLFFFPSTAPLSNKVLLTQCWKHVKLSLASSNQLLL